MNEPTGRQGRPGQHGLPCPECGALRAADNTPSCACAQRASEALRDTREAEAAAAEDFDPLRIRPYVELDPDGMPAPTHGASSQAHEASSAADVTMPLRAVPPSDPDAHTTALPVTAAPASSSPPLYGDDDDEPRGRRRRPLLIAGAAAAVAVVAAVGFAGGLFTYEKPTRDSAAAEDVRAAVPDTSPSVASETPSATRSASPSASPSSSPSPSESESPSPSASASSASPSASRSAVTSPSPTVEDSTPPLAPGNGADGADQSSPVATVLRPGDRGAEVTELQLRLGQLLLYNDEANGVFTSRVEEALRNYQWSRGIQDDEELGVYGQTTRTRLESETKEP
ncbi:peptidoglycan-binding protein [Streptomyces sp. NPDC002328]|uniref:peptidoglycan-binding domain-containing protein n=1 Tax=Streptomyces sp. NPDC002328 TaxID=3364642 RepID=UPI0036B51AEA